MGDAGVLVEDKPWEDQCVEAWSDPETDESEKKKQTEERIGTGGEEETWSDGDDSTAPPLRDARTGGGVDSREEERKRTGSPNSFEADAKRQKTMSWEEARDRSVKIVREYIKGEEVNSADVMCVPAGANDAKGCVEWKRREMDVEKRLNLERSYVKLPELQSKQTTAAFVEELCGPNFEEALRKCFGRDSTDPTEPVENWTCWAYPHLVPLGVIGAPSCMALATLTQVARDLQAMLKASCSCCSVVQVPVVSREKRNQTVSVPACKVSLLWLASLYMLCGESTEEMLATGSRIPVWLASPSRIFRRQSGPSSCPATPPIVPIDPQDSSHTRKEFEKPRASVPITHAETELMKLDLCHKLVLSGRVPCFRLKGGEQRKPSVVALYYLASSYSKLDGWAALGEMEGFADFARRNRETLSSLEQTCAVLEHFKEGELRNGPVLECMQSLYYSTNSTLECLPTKRARETRVSAHSVECITLDEVKRLLIDGDCYGGVLALADYVQKTACPEEDMLACKLGTKATEDVVSLVARGRNWNSRVERDQQGGGGGGGGGGKGRVVGSTSPLPTSSFQSQENGEFGTDGTGGMGNSLAEDEPGVAAPTTMADMTDKHRLRGFCGLQCPDCCMLVGPRVEVEKLQKLKLCVMWSGDKKETGLENCSPYPVLLDLLKDPDYQVRARAFCVLRRAITKMERRAVMTPITSSAAEHLGRFADVVGALFGPRPKALQLLINAVWYMPPQVWERPSTGGASMMRVKPVICGTHDFDTADGSVHPCSHTRMLSYYDYSVHGNLLTGILGYGSPGESCLDNVTLSVLLEALTEDRELARRYRYVSAWLTMPGDFQPCSLPITEEHVMIPGMAVLNQLYEMIVETRINEIVRVTMFCSIHPAAAYFDFPVNRERKWNIPHVNDPDVLEDGEISLSEIPCDDGYAARLIVALILDGATHDLYTDVTKKTHDRYSVDTLKAVCVSRSAPLLMEGEGGQAEFVRKLPPLFPLSHSKDQALPCLLTHEYAMLRSEPFSSLQVSPQWSPRSTDKQVFREKCPFLGRYQPTQTLGKCRWCLASWGGEPADPKADPPLPADEFVEVTGCNCANSNLSFSHQKCLVALSETRRLSPYFCCVCAQKHTTTSEWATKYDFCEDQMITSFETVNVKAPRQPPHKGNPSCEAYVKCCVCGSGETERHYFLFYGRPAFLRFDFCCKKCLKIFEISSHVTPLAEMLIIPVYEVGETSTKRLGSPEEVVRQFGLDSPFRTGPHEQKL